ncbi:hypothetical protein QTO34_008519 [Cnephaeus nilssonii]|uniref:Uncharacterized protein n=1 Tax=Cnephaeus nilssonii TaxID=3371016 RepID=A0AA40LU58_CNENI|nr:hypothetical protein QTO34_008519 [Eptesicus nilssonii]
MSDFLLDKAMVVWSGQKGQDACYEGEGVGGGSYSSGAPDRSEELASSQAAGSEARGRCNLQVKSMMGPPDETRDLKVEGTNATLSPVVLTECPYRHSPGTQQAEAKRQLCLESCILRKCSITDRLEKLSKIKSHLRRTDLHRPLVARCPTLLLIRDLVIMRSSKCFILGMRPPQQPRVIRNGYKTTPRPCGFLQQRGIDRSAPAMKTEEKQSRDGRR